MNANCLIILPLFIGTTELILISAVAFLLFGGKKLPELMKGLGKGIKEFKDGMNEISNPSPEDTQNHEKVQEGAPQNEEKKEEENVPSNETK